MLLSVWTEVVDTYRTAALPGPPTTQPGILNPQTYLAYSHPGHGLLNPVPYLLKSTTLLD